MQPSTTLRRNTDCPFLALGGMDGREDQIVLVEQRHAGLVAGGVGRVERQFGEEALAARVARRDLHKLREVGLADRGVLVHALEMRLVPAARRIEFGRPAGDVAAQRADGRDEVRPVLGAPRQAA